MGQLQADRQIIVTPEFFPVDTAHLSDQQGQRFLRVGCRHQLPGIAATGVHHRRRFRAVDQLRPAGRKTQPTPHGQVTGGTVRQTIPALHGQDRPAVAKRFAKTFRRLRQRLMLAIRRKTDVIALFRNIGRK